MSLYNWAMTLGGVAIAILLIQVARQLKRGRNLE